MTESAHLRDALQKIAKIAADAGASLETHGHHDHAHDHPLGVCTPKSLPANLLARAAKTATDIFPANSPGALASMILTPERITLITTKYWGSTRQTLSVSFMETTPDDLKRRILSHMNAWQCGITFALTDGVGQVRISRGSGGFWSFLGTDILHIPTSRQTMNLQSFTMQTRDSEFFRVIRHETGHTLGFPHEHMRAELVSLIDRAKAIAFFGRTQGWSPTEVEQQVLTPLDKNSIIGTPADQTSIMCYQLPGEITIDGNPIIGGIDINDTDRSFCQKLYPTTALTGTDAGEGDGSDGGDDGGDNGDDGSDGSATFLSEPQYV